MLEKEFQKIVDDYVDAKTREQEANKVVKSLNNEIKSYLQANNMTECTNSSGTRICTQIRHSESFDEENLIEYLKVAGLSRGLVKKKEYIDYDALESAIYRGKLSEEQLKSLNGFKNVTETIALVIRR
mgnify:CR=1 FL=1